MCADTPLTPEELVAAGEAIYGAGWKGRMAADLGMNSERTIARMAEGKHEIKSGIRADLAAIAQKKIAAIARIEATLTGK